MPALHTQPEGERESCLSGGREEEASSVQDGSDGEQRQLAPSAEDHTRGGWMNLGDGFIRRVYFLTHT